PTRYVLPAALSMGALAWTHTISLLIYPALLVAYLLVLAWPISLRNVRWRWTLLALAAAMGISCFYWAPLIVERAYIRDTGIMIARTFMLPISFYNWHNFLAQDWLYQYPLDPPFRLSLVYLTGLALSAPFLYRKPREWWFIAGVMLFCALMAI